VTRTAQAPGLRERLSYRFDRFMERGTIALIAGLAAVSVAIIAVIVGALVVLGGHEDIPVPQLLWMSLMRTLDPGTMGGDDQEHAGLFLAAMFAVTLAGIFVISTLIGILANGLQDKLANLRKGRSRVLERDHVVILGWSQQIFDVIAELVAGGAGRRRNSIVVLADRDRVEMEEAIRARVRLPRGTSVVCRTGRGSVLGDLAIANPDASRAIIVLQGEGDDPDVEVLKTILALTGRQDRRAEPYRIVAEVRDSASEGIARLVAGHEVHLLLADELIARIIAQTCRQSGLSTVYLELLDFKGHEFHVAEYPELAGSTFGDAVARVTGGIAAGIVRAGRARMAPPPGEVIGDGDRLVVLAEDHDSAAVGAPAEVDAGAIRTAEVCAPEPERILILGWNGRGPAIIRELDGYVAPGSEVVAVSPLERVLEVNQLTDLRNLRAAGRMESTTQRPSLDALDIPSFPHVIVLCESDDREPDMADARTLLTLLHLRDIEARGTRPFTIVSEMLDEGDRELAEVSEADDFIVSSRVLSLLLAQIAETPDLADVFRDMFDADGAEVYLRPATDYVDPGRPVTFATLQAAAQTRSEVALGYRVAARAKDAAAQYGVVMNPGREAAVTLAAEDLLVVLAEG
jgi:antitoxin (DNA-binding transcriptional repressor) of toxin-antitoxin stability system